jgi:hypothetical protein
MQLRGRERAFAIESSRDMLLKLAFELRLLEEQMRHLVSRIRSRIALARNRGRR